MSVNDQGTKKGKKILMKSHDILLGAHWHLLIDAFNLAFENL